MNLQDLLDSIIARDHILHYQKLNDYFNGSEKEYVFWRQSTNGNITTVKARILVKNEGEGNEEAIEYNPNKLLIPDTPFYDEIIAALPTYLSNHPEIEKYIFFGIDENNELAEVTIYEYDSQNDNIRKKNKIIYKKDGNLTIRDYIKSYAESELERSYTIN